MRIRTITAGVKLDIRNFEEQIGDISNFLHNAKERFVSSGVE